MKIEFCDLKKQYALLKDDIDRRMQKVVDSAAFINGPEVAELENRMSEYLGGHQAIGVANGTDALLIALMAAGIRAGDVVITTPFTFIATAEVIALLGAIPAFVDIDPGTYNISIDGIKAFLRDLRHPYFKGGLARDKVKAVIAVDLYGQCAEYDALEALCRNEKLVLIEDAAQSFGAAYKGRKACTFGDIACTSFFPAKPLGCYGDGGAVFTADAKLADAVRMIRNHGQAQRYMHEAVGLNGRLDTLQAAVLLAKFDTFVNKEIDRRNDVAARYSRALTPLAENGAIVLPAVREHNVSVWAQYSVRVLSGKRDALQAHLKDAGVPTAIHYPRPLSQQEAFAYLGYRSGDFPVSEATAAEIMSLPMHPYVTDEETGYICGHVERFFKS